MNFSERLKAERIRRGVTQKQMAEYLNMNAYTAYQKYELGATNPSVEKLILIANILDVSIDYLLCQTDKLGRNR